MLPPDKWGVYHLAGSGAGSRVEIAEVVLDSLGETSRDRPTIVPISAADFGAAAPRPAYSALSNGRAERTFSITLEPWPGELQRMLAERST